LWRDTLADGESAWVLDVLELLKPRVKKIDHLVEEIRPFLVADAELTIDDAGAAKHLTAEVRPVLSSLAEAFRGPAASDSVEIEKLVRSTAESRGIKAAALIHATRLAVTGRTVSAGLFDVLRVLGAARVAARLDRAVNYTARS